jgi:hypothetical protein
MQPSLPEEQKADPIASLNSELAAISISASAHATHHCVSDAIDLVETHCSKQLTAPTSVSYGSKLCALEALRAANKQKP